MEQLNKINKNEGIYDLLITRRSVRKFRNKSISSELLQKFIDGARYAPSAANLQPLRYIIVESDEKCKEVFRHLHWAKYLKDEGTPKLGEEPKAYIAILIDKSIPKTGYEQLDMGLSVQSIILQAYEQQIGSCIIAAMNRKEIIKILNIDTLRSELAIIVALGYCKEIPMAENIEKDGSIKYYKDQQGIHHVPKRRLEDILIEII